MEKLKKILSLLLAAAFVTAAMPLSSLTSAAEVPELALSDGSVWLADLGSDAVLDVNSAGDYKITTETDASANANFKLMPKTRFSALTDSVALSCDYRADATSFGFKTDYSLDGLRGNSNEYGSVEFYRVEAGNSTTIQMYVNGSAVNIKTFTATRATLRDIRIVEQNGSYYVKYGDWVLDGTGLSEEIQNAVKLENYFPRELLANNGMLYFFCTAVSISSGMGARIIIHNSFGDYSRNYSHTISGDANTPSKWVITADKAETTYNSDGNYIFSAGAGGTMSSFGIPVTTVTKGETESKSFITWNTFSETPADNRYNYFDFSNDPTFAEDSTETVSVIYVQYAGTMAHVAYGNTTIGCLNMLIGSEYTWYFTSDGTNVTGLDIHSGTNGGTFTGFSKLQVGKPIYLRIRKEYYDDGLTLTSKVKVSDSTLAAQVDALNESVNTAAASDDIFTAKTAADAFYASELRYAASYEAEANASDILIAYNNQIKADAEKVDSAVNALPPVDELMYQDKATIEAVRAMFDALNSDAQALVKTLDTLIEYENAAESLVDDGRYRTSDGSVYRVVYDPEGISLGSDEVNGALKTSVVGTASNSKSELGVVTGKKFPIVSGKYEMSQYFGTKDNSGRFGFAADDDENIFEGGYSNSFIMYRTESGNTTKLYTLIDGNTLECYSCTATRARLWTIGVTKQDGSWYVTVDGIAITGEGYSDEVKESLKLENHFSAEFLENNYSVHFFMYASSMHGAAYLRPTVSVENNLVLDVRDRISDPNGGVDGIVEKNVVNSSLTVSESGNVYNFDVPSVGSVILSEPLNKDGFSIKASMPLLSGNQWVYYTFSNDPDFLSGDEVEVVIVQFANTDGQNTVLYNKVEITTDRFSGFYGGSVTRKLSFVNDGGVYKLRLFTEGSDVIVSSPDFASLMKKPIYLKVTGDAWTEPNITITNSVSDDPAYTDSAALDQATEAYLAKEATVLGASIDSEISEIYSDKINFVYNKDKADALLTKLSTLSNRQKSEVKNSAQLYEINNYLISLANTDAESLVVCRRLLLGSIEWTAGNYDFYHDDSIDIRDMIRMKKIIAEIEKKN